MPSSVKFYVDFVAAPASAGSWPISARVNSSYPLENTKRLAQGSIEQKHFPWATRFEITDAEGTAVYVWPENS